MRDSTGSNAGDARRFPICSLLPGLFPIQHQLPNADSPVFRAHFVVAMLAYNLFTLAALHALLMSVAERQLHSARLNKALANCRRC